LQELATRKYDSVEGRICAMDRSANKSRVTVNPEVCGGRPCIRDTRIEIAVILDGLAEGLSFEDIIDHYLQLTPEDIRAALAYADKPVREGLP
jgi:uncharacterized protein (DUF433 family)